MQVTAVLVAVMATFAAAAPGNYACTDGTYECSGSMGWSVCQGGVWVSGGTCPPKTVCKFYPPSKSPYCVPPGFHFTKE